MKKTLFVLATAAALAGSFFSVREVLAQNTPPPQGDIIINQPWWCTKCMYDPHNTKCKDCPHPPNIEGGF